MNRQKVVKKVYNKASEEAQQPEKPLVFW